MRVRICLGAIGLILTMSACEDKKEPVQVSKHLDNTSPIHESVTKPVIPVVDSKVKGADSLKEAQDLATKAIQDSVASVTQARNLAAFDITKSVDDVELGNLEEHLMESPKDAMLLGEKKKTQSKIVAAVESVKHAKSASASKIVASVKAVETARDASSVSAPAMVGALDVVKTQASAKMAKSIAAVEVAKAHAAGLMAEATAKVTASSRLYGLDAKETHLEKSKAIGILAQSVGSVKVAEAKALGEISESVAAVEIAKAKVGIKPKAVLEGQSLYLKEIKTLCGISGADFAKKHSRSEWKAFKKSGTYLQEVQKICPKLTHTKETWENVLFPYTCAYALGSESIPGCH